MGEVVAEVTSIVRGRGHALGVVAALAAVVALVSAPVAFGNVDGDPIASATFDLKLSSGFKSRLKHNGVKMKPKKLKLLTGDVDPTTGTGDLTLRKLKFKKGKKQVACGKLTATLGPAGKIKGAECGKLFKLSGGTVSRNGFGADISGVKVKFLKSAAKQLNKRLELHSLHKGSAGGLSLSYQPTTVKVLSGEAVVTLDATLPAGSGTVASKLVAHCIDPLAGVTVVPPATTAGPAQPFHFPVTGGTVSPAGNDGVISAAGGVRLQNGKTGAPLGALQPADCPAVAPGTSTSTSYLDVTNLAPNLGLLNIQSNAFIGGTNPGCWSTNNPPGCGVFPGDKGPAIGQVLDASNATVSADASTKTIKINGVLIKNNATSSLVLNGLFPLAGTPGGGGAFGGPDPFADGDKFGTADLTVQVR